MFFNNNLIQSNRAKVGTNYYVTGHIKSIAERRGEHERAQEDSPVSVVRCSEALLRVSTMSLSAKASTDDVTSSHRISVGFFSSALCVCVCVCVCVVERRRDKKKKERKKGRSKKKENRERKKMIY